MESTVSSTPSNIACVNIVFSRPPTVETAAPPARPVRRLSTPVAPNRATMAAVAAPDIAAGRRASPVEARYALSHASPSVNHGSSS